MCDGFARCFLGKQFLDVDRTVCDLPGDPRLRDTGAVTGCVSKTSTWYIREVTNLVWFILITLFSVTLCSSLPVSTLAPGTGNIHCVIICVMDAWTKSARIKHSHRGLQRPTPSFIPDQRQLPFWAFGLYLSAMRELMVPSSVHSCWHLEL